MEQSRNESMAIITRTFAPTCFFKDYFGPELLFGETSHFSRERRAYLIVCIGESWTASWLGTTVSLTSSSR
jgi:hypothetical protein